MVSKNQINFPAFFAVLLAMNAKFQNFLQAFYLFLHVLRCRGLDSVWPALLKFPKNRIGVVDAVCMAHKPTAGGLGTSGKEHSVYAPGLSPYTAKQEELIVFAAFNYSSTTTAALGEAFMSLRVLGGEPNVNVLRAMAETAGDPWPSSKIAASFGLKEEDLLQEMELEGNRYANGEEYNYRRDSDRALAGGLDSSQIVPEENWAVVPSSMTIASLAVFLMLGVLVSQRWSWQQRLWRRQRSHELLKR